jgi:hypothetical protein
MRELRASGAGLRQRLKIFAETFRALEQVLAQNLIRRPASTRHFHDLTKRLAAKPLRIRKARGVISPRKRHQILSVQILNLILYSIHSVSIVQLVSLLFS